jgi:hypothetical protein
MNPRATIRSACRLSGVVGALDDDFSRTTVRGVRGKPARQARCRPSVHRLIPKIAAIFERDFVWYA